MTKALIIILFLNLSLFAESLTGRVVRVSDGDTITILDEEKKQYKIRLKHIDAPEKEQAYGKKAKEFLSKMIFGKDVKVQVDSKDRYGRYIGSVYLNEVFVNLEIVKNGWAWHYKKYSSDNKFHKVELLARKEKIGLWKDSKAIPPWEFRKK